MRSRILSISLCGFVQKLPLLGSIAWDQHQTFGLNEPISGFMEKLDFNIDSFRGGQPSGPLGLMPLPASMSRSREHPVGPAIPHHSRTPPHRAGGESSVQQALLQGLLCGVNLPSRGGPKSINGSWSVLLQMVVMGASSLGCL